MATYIQSQNDHNTKIKTLRLTATKKIHRHNNDIFSSSKIASLISVCVFSFFIPYVIANSELNLHSTSTISSLDVINTNRTVHSLKLRDGQHGDNVEGFATQASGCQSCMIREELRNLSLEAIKEQILSKLGMKQAPNITGRQLPNLDSLHQILALFGMGDSGHGASHGMQGDDPSASPVFKPGPVILDEEDDYHARTERVIAFAQPHPRLRHGWRGQDIQYFRFSDKVARNRVLSAQLWVYVRGTDHEFPASSSPTSSSSMSSSSSEGNDGSIVTPFNISVMKVMRTGETKSDSPPYAQVLSEKRHRPRGKGGWISLAIKGLMVEWFKNPRNNFGVVIQSTDSQGRQLVVTDHDQENRTLVPFVEVNTTDGRKHRTKRTIGLNCDESSKESRCCRYPLTVDFEEFGWDWIIAPKKYEANYCSGECPYVFLQKYPHTHIVHLANPAGTAGPCCAPRKMSSISMLYFDNEFNIIYGLLPGMVVDRCGCS